MIKHFIFIAFAFLSLNCFSQTKTNSSGEIKKIVKINKNFLSFFKLFIFTSNTWCNIISNKTESLKFFKNSPWYIREAYEFFGIDFF